MQFVAGLGNVLVVRANSYLGHVFTTIIASSSDQKKGVAVLCAVARYRCSSYVKLHLQQSSPIHSAGGCDNDMRLRDFLGLAYRSARLAEHPAAPA